MPRVDSDRDRGMRPGLARLPARAELVEAAMLGLSAVFMLMTFVVFAFYGVFAAAVREHIVTRPRVLTWMRRTFAAAFVALGLRLALTERA